MPHADIDFEPVGRSEWGKNVKVKLLHNDARAAVELWQNRKSKKLKVFKIIKRNREGYQELDTMLQLRHLKHPNIIDLELYEEDWTERTMLLVLPYFHEGDLHNWMGRNFWDRDPPEGMLWDAFTQLSSAVCFLHNLPNPIFHLDIKPKNIFVDLRTDGIYPEAVKFVLADFGHARNWSGRIRDEYWYHGTLAYIPPENELSYMYDVWQIGATIHHCALGKPPVREAYIVPPSSREDYMRRFDPDRTGKIDIADVNHSKQKYPRGMHTENWGSRYSADLFRLLEKTLAQDPMDRPKGTDLPSLVLSMHAGWVNRRKGERLKPEKCGRERLEWQKRERERLERERREQERRAQEHQNRRMERENVYDFSTDGCTYSGGRFGFLRDGYDWSRDDGGGYYRG